MGVESGPDEEPPIPAVLLSAKGGGAAPRVGVRNTNWKGVTGIVAAVIVAPNLLVWASSLPAGAMFGVILSVAVALPLTAVLAGILMSVDIRGGAESSKTLAVAAIAVGMLTTVVLIISLVLLSAATR
jgi:hypothetical protein